MHSHASFAMIPVLLGQIATLSGAKWSLRSLLWLVYYHSQPVSHNHPLETQQGGTVASMLGSCTHRTLLSPATGFCARQHSSAGTSTSAPASHTHRSRSRSHRCPTQACSASHSTCSASWQATAPFCRAQRPTRRRTGECWCLLGLLQRSCICCMCLVSRSVCKQPCCCNLGCLLQAG